MSCSKEKQKNNQCQYCKIKDLVNWDGRVLLLPTERKNAVRWKTIPGDAWLSLPDISIAHCGIGLLIVLADNIAQ